MKRQKREKWKRNKRTGIKYKLERELRPWKVPSSIDEMELKLTFQK